MFRAENDMNIRMNRAIAVSLIVDNEIGDAFGYRMVRIRYLNIDIDIINKGTFRILPTAKQIDFFLPEIATADNIVM